MTREDIKQRMSEAGLKTPAKGDFIFIHWDQIALLIKHERRAEREACAKVCEDDAKYFANCAEGSSSGMYDWKHDAATDCAVAIRARGNTTLRGQQ